MRPASVLHQGLVLLKLFPVSHVRRSRTTGSLPQCHPNTSPTQLTGASTELLYPCATGVHLPLVGFPLVFLKTKDSICFLEYLSGKKAKLFWGYSRLAIGVFVVLILVAVGRREKIQKRELGKDEGAGQIAERPKRRGCCWLERKQVGLFWCCVNLVVLGQIQWRLASFH